MRLQHSSGFSLISVVIAIGISGILALIVDRFTQTGYKGMRAAQIGFERMNLATSLTNKLSCSQSSVNTQCSASGARFIELRDKSGNVLVSSSGTRYGDWAAVAECAPSGGGVVLKVARLKRGASMTATPTDGFLIEDPMRKRFSSWDTGTASVVPGGLALCSVSGSGSANSYHLHHSEAETAARCGPISFASATALATENEGPQGIAETCSSSVVSGNHSFCGLTYVRDGDGGGYCRIRSNGDGTFTLSAFSNDSRGNAADPFGVACEMQCF